MGSAGLLGDAAHTVPPTGAKGLNLAINDVLIMHEFLVEPSVRKAAWMRSTRTAHGLWIGSEVAELLYWMTQMLHTPVDGVGSTQAQLGELNAVVSSTAGQTYLAESYTGWPDIIVDKIDVPPAITPGRVRMQLWHWRFQRTAGGHGQRVQRRRARSGSAPGLSGRNPNCRWGFRRR